jgi:hypothetical protein
VAAQLGFIEYQLSVQAMRDGFPTFGAQPKFFPPVTAKDSKLEEQAAETGSIPSRVFPTPQ